MMQETSSNRCYLLPYKFQIIGWWLVAAAILFGVTIVVGDMNGWFRNIPVLFAYIPAFAGILLICLSREKIDDEYISALRGRIVCLLVVVAFVARIIQSILTVLRITYGWSTTGIWSVMSAISVLYQPILLAALYIIILKTTLFIQNQRINRYAEQ